MTIDRFGERYIEPGAEIIANMIDGDGYDQSINLFSFVGVPGTIPTTLDVYAQTRAVLQNLAVPMNPKAMAMIVSPDMEVKALGFQNNLFNPTKEISDQYLMGTMGQAVGYKWSAAQNVRMQTVGTLTASTPVVSGNNQTGNLLATSGWAVNTQVLNQGDIISVVACYAINPISYRTVNKLRTFVVTANVTSDGGGLASIPISPDIVADPTSPFQTVAATPVSGNAIYVYATAAANFANITGVVSPQGLAFHRECFALVIAKLEKPGGMEWSEEVSNPRVGLSIRLVRGYDIRSNRKYTRLDVLGGWAAPRPEMGCRVAS